jgi:hypothetical protein
MRVISINKNIIISNLEEKFFVWSPPKTASNTLYHILEKLKFNTYLSDGKSLIFYSEKPKHNHSTNIFFGHENFNLITTIRNPYRLMISKFLNVGGQYTVNSKSFSKFLESWLYNDENKLTYLSFYNYSERSPDNLIRVESMFDDYLKIPFIKKSDYYKSGELLNDCNTKYNPSKCLKVDWKSLYTQNSADMVYYNFAHVFELGQYNKNSWK